MEPHLFYRWRHKTHLVVTVAVLIVTPPASARDRAFTSIIGLHHAVAHCRFIPTSGAVIYPSKLGRVLHFAGGCAVGKPKVGDWFGFLYGFVAPAAALWVWAAPLTSKSEVFDGCGAETGGDVGVVVRAGSAKPHSFEVGSQIAQYSDHDEECCVQINSLVLFYDAEQGARAWQARAKRKTS